LKVNSWNASKILIGETGAECLNKAGDAYLKLGGELRRVQIAKINP